MSDPIDVFEHMKALRAMGEVVSQADVDWLIQRTEYLLTLASQRDEAMAEVIRLRALLAEPSEEEAERLGRIAWNAYYYGGPAADRYALTARAILADLRERAGGGE